MSKTGRKTQREGLSWIKEASPDDPIYTRGYMIGGKRSRTSLKDTPETTSPSAKKKPEHDEFYINPNLPPEEFKEELMEVAQKTIDKEIHQQFQKKDGSDSTTGGTPQD